MYADLKIVAKVPLLSTKRSRKVLIIRDKLIHPCPYLFTIFHRVPHTQKNRGWRLKMNVRTI